MQDNLFSSTNDKDYQIKNEMDLIEHDWNIPPEFPDLRHCKELAVDLETCDPNLKTLGPGWARKDGYIVGIAIASNDWQGYFPIRHNRGQNMDPKMALRWLKQHMETPNIDKIMHNATYDLGWMRAEGIEAQGRVIDTMITGALVDENRFSYALNSLGKDYLGETKNERLLRAAAKDFHVDPKSEMYKLPPKYVGAYAEQDAALTLRLWHCLQNEIATQDLKSIWELETALIPMMLDMKTNGVRVDIDGADRAKTFLQSKVKELHKFIKDKSGLTVEPWASASVAKVFDAIGETYTVTEQGSPSFTKQWLQNHPHEVAQAIVRLREFDKADSTFVDTILRHAHKGRIHAEFHQLRSDDGGTVTGRFSSSNPNLQQIPSRDKEIKKLIRGLFIPEDGCKWGSFDYASQEPRLLVHFANLITKSPSLDKIVNAYKEGVGDLHQMVADMADISRTEAKTVNLGIMYGMGKGKLATQLLISKDEATELLETHHKNVPFVKDLANIASERAESAGSIRTLLGRRCRFDLFEPKSYTYNKPLPFKEAMEKHGPILRRAFTYKALNKLIQGSAADQTKKAMLDCYQEGLLPMLTVHDELCFSVEGDSQAHRIKDIMENGLSDVLTVPSSVDDELVDNWGQVS